MATTKPSTKWAKGTSGNRAGRPKGRTNRSTQVLQAMLANDAVAILKSVVGAAKTGDGQAARFLLGLVIPTAKERPVQLEIGPTSTLAEIDAAHSVVLAEVCAGSLTPGEGAALANLLDGKRRALEGGELERRIAELELKGKP